jgi:glycosyltransferase involved in cell wall biosynthesis
MKIVWISDLDVRGSGYGNISTSLCKGLADRGHEVKVAGLGYKGEEHNFPFSIIPASNIQEALGITQNLYNLWGFDTIIVALDIPLQERIIQSIGSNRPFKYVGIFPVEADPLCLSWAMVLMQMDKCLIISEFGTNEAIKMGVEADHIQIGVDTDSWRPPTKEEREKLRVAMGIDEDCFVVLTVADNQERKLLSRSMEIYSDFSANIENTKYMMVTREHSKVGWTLRDLAQELGISNKFMLFEKGLPFYELWALYAISDVFLLTSKAEGLGMILLEAMATGAIALGTDCTAISELINKGQGFLIPSDYSIRDPFGNGRRYYASREKGTELLTMLYEKIKLPAMNEIRNTAREYVETRTWDVAVDKLEETINYEQKKEE